MKYPKSKLFEKLADIEHQRWSDWQKYFIKNMRYKNLKRWKKQSETAYKDLSEEEKDSDREQVMRYWKLLKSNLITK
jgi:hypothetical protein